MKSSGLLTEIKNHPRILVLVIVIHIGLVILLSINLSNNEKPPMPATKQHNIINAVAVDAKQYDEREKQKELAAKKLIEQKNAAEQKRRQELQRKKALEQKRLVRTRDGQSAKGKCVC